MVPEVAARPRRQLEAEHVPLPFDIVSRQEDDGVDVAMSAMAHEKRPPGVEGRAGGDSWWLLDGKNGRRADV
jgi:hypothetical protein